jgi:hypothetical protein
MIATNYGNEICYGTILSDKGSKDEREEFINKTKDIIHFCLNGNSFSEDKNITILKDFVKMDKFQSIQKHLDEGGTIEEFVKDIFCCYH